VAARESTAVVREESHLDEMRAAIRGDFERLERRRGGQQVLSAPRPRSDEPAPQDDEAEREPPARSWLGRLLGR